MSQTTDRRGRFQAEWAKDHPRRHKRPNDACVYFCVDCRDAGIEHEVIDVAGPLTDRYSTWGAGLPTTMRQCTACERQDGPWVSSDLVGGGW